MRLFFHSNNKLNLKINTPLIVFFSVEHDIYVAVLRLLNCCSRLVSHRPPTPASSSPVCVTHHVPLLWLHTLCVKWGRNLCASTDTDVNTLCVASAPNRPPEANALTRKVEWLSGARGRDTQKHGRNEKPSPLPSTLPPAPLKRSASRLISSHNSCAKMGEKLIESLVLGFVFFFHLTSQTEDLAPRSSSLYSRQRRLNGCCAVPASSAAPGPKEERRRL